MAPRPTTRVEIFDQSYTVGGEGGSDYMRQLAGEVDAKMRQVARASRQVDSLRVAVLTAINLADENHLLRERVHGLERAVGERAAACSRKLERLLNRAG